MLDFHTMHVMYERDVQSSKNRTKKINIINIMIKSATQSKMVKLIFLTAI